MKLRNKKTGEVVVEINKIGLVWNKYGMPAEIGQYDSIAELNDEWEDYPSQEPLIKDEQIRKAVRAWAEALGANIIRFERFSQGFSSGDGSMYSSIDFDTFLFNLIDGKKYTIAELCGEEEG